MAINNIPVKQKQTELVALLRARFRAYRRAKYVQGFFVSVAIILPVASTFLVSAHPKISPYFAFAALLILFLDVAFFQTFQKDHIKTGAKLQEEFDIEVFELPWNYFIAGQKIDHEDVRQLSAKYLPASEESWLISWYDPATGEIPLTLGRLVCQRSNVTYDARLRKRYGNGLLYGTITLGVSLVIVGIAFEMSLSELLLTVGVPSTPIFNWVLRERKKQVETTAMLLNLKTECEKLWNKALK